MNASTDSLRVVYVAANVQQAHLLTSVLADEGIAASVSNEALQVVVGSVPAGFPTAPRVLVDAKDALRAREIALEFERKLRPLKAPAAPGRSWNQFTIRALLFLTACVAAYLGVERAITLSGGHDHSGGGIAAVFLLASVAFVLAMCRKLRDQRSDEDV